MTRQAEILHEVLKNYRQIEELQDEINKLAEEADALPDKDREDTLGKYYDDCIKSYATNY